MPLEKLSGPGKALRNKLTWNFELRLGLLVLKDDLNLSWATTTIVFNNLFKDHIASCGLDKVSRTAVNAQYHEKYKNKPCFREALAATVEQRNEMKRRISVIADNRVLVTPQRARVLTLTPPATPENPVATKRKRTPSLTVPLHTPPSTDCKTTSLETSAILETSANSMKFIRRDPIVVIPRRTLRTSQTQLSLDGPSTPYRTTVTRRLPFTPEGPSKTPMQLKSRNPLATIPYITSGGKEIMLTPKQKEETLPDLVPVSEAEAHPNVPLLFRFWDDNSQSPLTDSGFTAGRVALTIISPPPPPKVDSIWFPWNEFFLHLQKTPCFSFFISTSNDFTWTLRTAMKELKRGKNMRISVIDPTKINRRAIFHALPVHNALRKKKPFNNGAFMYRGMRDFMIWAKIPRDAVITTVSAQAIFELTTKDHHIGAILRLQQLIAGVDYEKKILPLFKAQGVTLTPSIIKAMARICKTLHIDISRVEMVASLVCDLVKGFALQLPQSREDWQRAASSDFARAICSLSPNDWDINTYLAMQWAFLDGLRWAQGDFNARQKPKHMATMLSRANKVGLGSLTDILSSELDAVKIGVFMHEEKQQKLLHGSSSLALLADSDNDEDAIVFEDYDDPVVEGHGEEFITDDSSTDCNDGGESDVSEFEL